MLTKSSALAIVCKPPYLIASICILCSSCGGNVKDEGNTSVTYSQSAISLAETSQVITIVPGRVFEDSFTRDDSQNLGIPNIGGTWSEGNELFATLDSSPTRGTIYPADIRLSNGAMTFHYSDPQTDYLISHAQPYAFAMLSRAISKSNVSIDFTPAPSGGRVAHEIGLMNASGGFFVDSGLTPSDYSRYEPVHGFGVAIGRSSYAYNNSAVTFLKFDGIGNVSNLDGDHFLPFQFDQGVTYHIVLTRDGDALSVTVSNGSATVTYSASLGTFTSSTDQLYVNDEQAGNDGIRFDNFIVSTTDSITVPFNLVPKSINIGSMATKKIPIQIFSTSDFDASQIVPTSISVSGNSTSLQTSGHAKCSVIDLNADGKPDIQCNIPVEDLNLQIGDTSVHMQAFTYGGVFINGNDTVVVK